MQYADFLASKALIALPSGREVQDSDIHPSLFPFQRDMVRYALRKGRAGLFEATGLGKTRQQIEFARLSGERALIVAPLGVTRQTIREGGAPGTPLLWFGIEEGDTLNRRRKDGYAGLDEAREADDNRHICPLQLGTIERCVRLWSNRGETVLSPFGGIGSEGYVAVKHGRRAVLCELKPAYWRCGVQNLTRIEDELKVPDLFSSAGLLL